MLGPSQYSQELCIPLLTFPPLSSNHTGIMLWIRKYYESCSYQLIIGQVCRQWKRLRTLNRCSMPTSGAICARHKGIGLQDVNVVDGDHTESPVIQLGCIPLAIDRCITGVASLRLVSRDVSCYQVGAVIQGLLTFFNAAFQNWLFGLWNLPRSKLRIPIILVDLFEARKACACTFLQIGIFLPKPLASPSALCFHLNGMDVFGV